MDFVNTSELSLDKDEVLSEALFLAETIPDIVDNGEDIIEETLTLCQLIRKLDEIIYQEGQLPSRWDLEH